MANYKSGNVSADQLRSIIERIENLEEEKAGIAADIRDVFAEAKGNGFDVKALRSIIKLRKMEAHERDEQEMVLDTYLRALGMAPDVEEDETPSRASAPAPRASVREEEEEEEELEEA